MIAHLPSCQEYHAIDASSVAISRAKERKSSPLINFINKDLQSFSSEKLFDLILLICSLEHIKDQSSLISQLKRNLSPGGEVICVYSNKRSFFRFNGRFFLYFNNGRSDIS